MANPLIPPPRDLAVIIIVAIILSAIIYCGYEYTKLPKEEPPFCMYEVKYVHISGQEKTKRIYMDCNGFTDWAPGSGAVYKVPYMTISFRRSNSVYVYGATDILSIKKLK